MMRRLALPFLAFSLAFLPAAFAHSQGTRLWTESKFDELEKGTPNGVAITSDGRLEPGPASRQVFTTPSTYVWAVAADREGNAYLATGTPATVLRVTPDGKSTTLFTSREMSVQSVRVGPDGSVYAATLPSGKVYKLDPHVADRTEDNATVVFDPAATEDKPKYVWGMTFDAEGRLYIAAGGPAAVYRVGQNGKIEGGGKPEVFFKSDEQHIRSIAFDSAGNLIAGSDGSGLIYRIDKAGKPYVLYDSPKKEITSVTVAPNGTIYAAGVGEKGHNPLPPLPVTGVASVTATITIIAPGSVQAFNGNTLIPEGSDVYEIAPNSAPRKLWSSHDDIVYALAATKDGLLASTGNRGRIYRLNEDGTYADIAHLEASQATGFADTAQGLYVGTANSGKVYLLSHGQAAEGNYLSDVFDAGAFSQWGRAEVEIGSSPKASSFELFARAGNVENPLRAWGEWKKITPNNGALGIEASRFVQWKLVLHPGASIGSVGINYLSVNLPPVVDEIVVEPGARVNAAALQSQLQQQVTINFASSQNGMSFTQDPAREPLAAVKDKSAVTARWLAHDDNGDELSFSIYYRGEGEQNWQPLRTGFRDRYDSFDAARLPDGRYYLKVVASDAPSHNPGEALTGARESDEFLIDTTPPVVSGLEARLVNGKIHTVFTAADSTSPVTRAEYAIDAGRWQYIEPSGKLADSLTEKFEFDAPLPAPHTDAPQPDLKPDPQEHVIAIRVYDRSDNLVTVKAVVH
jgi:sugar lactone lactonase YvrE